MKYKKNEILYFKPLYNKKIKYCLICQIVKYLKETKQYLVVASDIYSPCHYVKCIVNEDDLDYIDNTFLVNEINIDNLYIKISLSDVMKLQFYDLYSEMSKL